MKISIPNRSHILRSVWRFTALVLFGTPAWAQDRPPVTSPSPAAPNSTQWTYYASALGYVLPEGESYVSPVIAADRRKLHLEARYNYENQQTGSLWIGRNLSFGQKTTLDLTPMIGAVFGRSNGFAPGLLASLQYRRFSVESEIEYLIETDREESFFYSWSEAFSSPREWIRAGIVVQRTKAYRTAFAVQRGVLGGVSWKGADFTTYVLDPGTADPVIVFGFGLQF